MEKKQKRLAIYIAGLGLAAGAGMLALILFWSRFHGFFTPAGTEPAPEYVFSYAENQPSDYPTARGAERFAQLVEERTGGRIRIRIFAEGELGEEESVFRQLQYGGIDFARVSVMTVSDVIPMMNVLQLPYLYRDSSHMWQVLDGEIGSEFMDALNTYDLKGLSWYDAGARHFYNSVRPVERLEDMRGLKIRVAQSQLMEAMVSALGAKPVTLDYSEVYAALETGEINGAENNWPSYETMRHYEVAPYITEDAHNRIPEIQVMSAATWNRLSEEDQKIIQECAKESAQYQRTLWEKQEENSRERLSDGLCKVSQLSEEEYVRFRRAVMPLYQTFSSEYFEYVNRIILTQ